MAAPSPQAPDDDLLDLLAYLSGHFETASSQDRRAVDNLREQLVRALGHDDLTAIRSHFLSIDGSDLFSSEAIAPSQRARLSQLVDRIGPVEPVPELRVFVRNVPVRSTLIPGSVPAWAAGASVAQTLGPFTGVDGRSTGSTSSASRGSSRSTSRGPPNPHSLFNARVAASLRGARAPPMNSRPTASGSMRGCLASNAPPGCSRGLRSGRGALTAERAAATRWRQMDARDNDAASPSLDLDPTASTGQPMTTVPMASTRDTRQLQLPGRFAFHFTGKRRRHR